MRVPLVAALSLLEVIQEAEIPALSKAVFSRAETLSEDDSLIENMITQLGYLVETTSAINEHPSEWGGLDGAFAALAMWLSQDMRHSTTSEELTKLVQSRTQSKLFERFSVQEKSPSDHLVVINWAVGAPWSGEDEYSAVTFPFNTLGLSDDVAIAAYEGLIEQLRWLEALKVAEEPDMESEMLVSSVPVRVVGLAQSLNPTIVAEANQQGSTASSLYLLNTQLNKLDHPSKDLVFNKRWFPLLEPLNHARNAIAHLSRNRDNGFMEIRRGLSRKYALDLGRLAAAMMSAELVQAVNEKGDQKARFWLEHIMKQLSGERDLVQQKRDLLGEYRFKTEGEWE